MGWADVAGMDPAGVEVETERESTVLQPPPEVLKFLRGRPVYNAELFPYLTGPAGTLNEPNAVWVWLTRGV